MSADGTLATIRPLQSRDREVWADLFARYREFYELNPDPFLIDRVWSWVTDPGHEVNALVAERDGRIVGIAHWRRFARPSAGATGIWLDDLFVDPGARGGGTAGALIARLQEIASAEGASVVRWITANTNQRARALYDRVAEAGHWVVYDARPAD